MNNDELRKALPRLVGMLRWIEDGIHPRLKRENFNMGCTGVALECGTAACIGGWAYLLTKGTMQEDGRFFAPTDYNDARYYVVNAGIDDETGAEGGVHELFFPPIPRARFKDVTPGQAADAIQCFLLCGHPHWEKILPALKEMG